jgi:RNA polymerase primary sigma factor
MTHNDLPLSSLTERERKVFMMRFYHNMEIFHSLEEIAKHFEVSRERIRQIELKTLRKLLKYRGDKL